MRAQPGNTIVETRTAMTSHLPVVRSASLTGYTQLAQALGLDAAAMLRRAGLTMRSLENPQAPISTQSVQRLLQDSARASGVEDFGLRLAATRSMASLGVISLVLKEEPTVRSALDTLCRYLTLLNASLTTEMTESDGLLCISEDFIADPRMRKEQGIQLAVGVMHRILRELLGESWQPVRVCLKQPAPSETQGFESFFGRHVEFAAAFNGIVCRVGELSHQRMGGSSAAAAFARRHLDEELARGVGSAQGHARQLIAALLPSGRCTASQVARHLGVDRRTLHRHLFAEGTDFSGVLQSVRVEIVSQQLLQHQRSMAQVASLLGFASSSAFAYWFRGSFECSPRQWRQRLAATQASTS